MQEREAWKTVRSIVQKHAGIRPIGGELHQSNGAAGASLHTEGDHPRAIVVTSIETGVSTKGFPFFQHTIEP